MLARKSAAHLRFWFPFRQKNTTRRFVPVFRPSPSPVRPATSADSGLPRVSTSKKPCRNRRHYFRQSRDAPDKDRSQSCNGSEKSWSETKESSISRGRLLSPAYSAPAG